MSTKSKKQSVPDDLITFDPSQMITIVTSDKMEFIIDKRVAMASKVIKNMLTGPYKENEGRIEFDQFDGQIFEKVIQYFYYKARYDKDPDNRPEFPIDPSISLQLMMVAHYLET